MLSKRNELAYLLKVLEGALPLPLPLDELLLLDPEEDDLDGV